MFKAGDKVVCKRTMRWRNDFIKDTVAGPVKGDICEVLRVEAVHHKTGLYLKGYSLMYPFDSDEFEKIISNGTTKKLCEEVHERIEKEKNKQKQLEEV